MFIRVVLPAPFSPSRAENLALFQGEIDVVVGKDARESLRNAAQFQNWWHAALLPAR